MDDAVLDQQQESALRSVGDSQTLGALNVVGEIDKRLAEITRQLSQPPAKLAGFVRQDAAKARLEAEQATLQTQRGMLIRSARTIADAAVVETARRKAERLKAGRDVDENSAAIIAASAKCDQALAALVQALAEREAAISALNLLLGPDSVKRLSHRSVATESAHRAGLNAFLLLVGMGNPAAMSLREHAEHIITREASGEALRLSAQAEA